MPGVGEVQLIARLFDDPDHVRALLERGHERGDVATAEEVGDPLQVVEAQILLGEKNHEVRSQGLANTVEFLTLGDQAQVNAVETGAEGAGDRRHGERGRTHAAPLGRPAGRGDGRSGSGRRRGSVSIRAGPPCRPACSVTRISIRASRRAASHPRSCPAPSLGRVEPLS